MHRKPLLQLLENYQPADKQEAVDRQRIIDFVQRHPDCCSRTLTHGHITGSAWLLNPTRDKVLLTLHKKLRLWLQLGGHADDETDPLQVALREAREESGIQHVKLLATQPFHLATHDIPAHKATPAHKHYDLTFLLQAVDTECYQVSNESIDLKWFTRHELGQLSMDRAMQRLTAKWLTLPG